jgi:methionyl-tRNA formyltransferase
MPVPTDFKFTVLGKISYTDFFVKELYEKGFPAPLVIVSLDNEYIRDDRLLSAYGLKSNMEELADMGLCHLHKEANVSSESVRELIQNYNSNICISINCRDIIKKPIIELFKGQIFNIHGSYLPSYRGAAPESWRILNGDEHACATIHYLDEGIDTGAIVIQNKKKIKTARPKPIDFIQEQKQVCELLLKEFLELILKVDEIPGKLQENNDSFYLPRLYTEINGAINWDWDIHFIERFIRAFSEPYPCAFTYYREKKVNIFEVLIDTQMGKRFHPFCNGRIITVIDNNAVRVVAGGKPLIITKIVVDDKIRPPSEIMSLGQILHTPINCLYTSKTKIPSTMEMK